MIKVPDTGRSSFHRNLKTFLARYKHLRGYLRTSECLATEVFLAALETRFSMSSLLT